MNQVRQRLYVEPEPPRDDAWREAGCQCLPWRSQLVGVKSSGALRLRAAAGKLAPLQKLLYLYRPVSRLERGVQLPVSLREPIHLLAEFRHIHRGDVPQLRAREAVLDG